MAEYLVNAWHTRVGVALILPLPMAAFIEVDI